MGAELEAIAKQGTHCAAALLFADRAAPADPAEVLDLLEQVRQTETERRALAKKLEALQEAAENA